MIFDKLYGINFTRENSETISLVFLSIGRMVCPVRVSLSDKSELDGEGSWIYMNSVKTQYAGYKVHQLLIHFLRYLNEKYFRDFQMKDESYYWETNDEAKMIAQFKVYDALIDQFELAVETFPLLKNEDIEEYFQRLIKHLNNLRKNL